jgi:hypothetical protein
MSKDKEIKTEIEISDFKGHPLLKIWELRPDGNRTDSPLISIGVKKCKAVYAHMGDIEQFIKDNSK